MPLFYLIHHLKVLQLLGSPIIVTVLPFPVLDLSQAPFKTNLIALLGWVIILMPHEISRHRLHRSHFSCRIMCVLIIFAIAQFFHEFGGSIANLQRYWLIGRFFNVFLDFLRSSIDRVGFRRSRQIDYAFRQVDVSFWHPQELTSLIDVNRDV